MRVFYGTHALPDFKNAVITIGSFDGVHLGHQKILERIRHMCNETTGESIVLTFDPHPRSVIYPKDKSLRLISSLEEKLDLFRTYGINNTVIVPFTVEFSQISAQEYLEKFLVKNFNPAYVIIGYDHRFGLNRQGDIQMLRNYAGTFGYKVIEIPKHEIDAIAISSSKIRTALTDGDLDTANTLLNHPFQISGKVVRGNRIGTQLGFPTANVQLDDPMKLLPRDGIYAVRTEIKGRLYESMLYIGHIPTLSADLKKSVEVNIFDFEEDIYDTYIRLEVLSYLRNDQKFKNLEALQSQLIRDKEMTRAFFALLPKNEIPPVTIAVLNFNTKHYLETFLPSISYSTDDYDFDTVVLDNNSQDKSTTFLSEWFPEVKTIEFSRNYGFAEGYNRGIQEIQSKYTVLLNTDVLVPEDWLTPLVKHLETHEDVAAVMPKVLSLHNKTLFEYAGASGGFMDGLGYPFCRGRVFEICEKDTGQYDEARDIFWTSGAAMVVRTAVFKNLGGFDEDYFAHQEEIDLCWRIQRAGYRISVLPESEIYHIGGGTLSYDNPEKMYLNFRNNLSTLVKNEVWLHLLWILPLRFILDMGATLKCLLSGQFKHGWNIVRAYGSTIINLPGLLRKRFRYSRLISRSRRGPAKILGRIRTPIVFGYYLFGKKTYKELAK